eukprot:scaffold37417_cov31-Tisochrysis_lutea.AAC.3
MDVDVHKCVHFARGGHRLCPCCATSSWREMMSIEEQLEHRAHLSENRPLCSCDEAPDDWCATPSGVICNRGIGKKNLISKLDKGRARSPRATGTCAWQDRAEGCRVYNQYAGTRSRLSHVVGRQTSNTFGCATRSLVNRYGRGARVHR